MIFKENNFKDYSATYINHENLSLLSHQKALSLKSS